MFYYRKASILLFGFVFLVEAGKLYATSTSKNNIESESEHQKQLLTWLNSIVNNTDSHSQPIVSNDKDIHLNRTVNDMIVNALNFNFTRITNDSDLLEAEESKISFILPNSNSQLTPMNVRYGERLQPYLPNTDSQLPELSAQSNNDHLFYSAPDLGTSSFRKNNQTIEEIMNILSKEKTDYSSVLEPELNQYLESITRTQAKYRTQANSAPVNSAPLHSAPVVFPSNSNPIFLNNNQNLGNIDFSQLQQIPSINTANNWPINLYSAQNHKQINQQINPIQYMNKNASDLDSNQNSEKPSSYEDGVPSLVTNYRKTSGESELKQPINSEIPFTFKYDNKGKFDYSSVFQPYVSQPIQVNPFQDFDNNSFKDISDGSTLEKLPNIENLFDQPNSFDVNQNEDISNSTSDETNILDTEEDNSIRGPDYENPYENPYTYQIQNKHNSYENLHGYQVQNTGTYDPNIAYENLKHNLEADRDKHFGAEENQETEINNYSKPNDNYNIAGLIDYPKNDNAVYGIEGIKSLEPQTFIPIDSDNSGIKSPEPQTFETIDSHNSDGHKNETDTTVIYDTQNSGDNYVHYNFGLKGYDDNYNIETGPDNKTRRVFRLIPKVTIEAVPMPPISEYDKRPEDDYIVKVEAIPLPPPHVAKYEKQSYDNHNSQQKPEQIENNKPQTQQPLPPENGRPPPPPPPPPNNGPPPPPPNNRPPPPPPNNGPPPPPPNNGPPPPPPNNGPPPPPPPPNYGPPPPPPNYGPPPPPPPHYQQNGRPPYRKPLYGPPNGPPHYPPPYPPPPYPPPNHSPPSYPPQQHGPPYQRPYPKPPQQYSRPNYGPHNGNYDKYRNNNREQITEIFSEFSLSDMANNYNSYGRPPIPEGYPPNPVQFDDDNYQYNYNNKYPEHQTNDHILPPPPPPPPHHYRSHPNNYAHPPHTSYPNHHKSPPNPYHRYPPPSSHYNSPPYAPHHYSPPHGPPPPPQSHHYSPPHVPPYPPPPNHYHPPPPSALHVLPPPPPPYHNNYHPRNTHVPQHVSYNNFGNSNGPQLHNPKINYIPVQQHNTQPKINNNLRQSRKPVNKCDINIPQRLLPPLGYSSGAPYPPMLDEYYRPLNGNFDPNDPLKEFWNHFNGLSCDEKRIQIINLVCKNNDKDCNNLNENLAKNVRKFHESNEWTPMPDEPIYKFLAASEQNFQTIVPQEVPKNADNSNIDDETKRIRGNNWSGISGRPSYDSYAFPCKGKSDGFYADLTYNCEVYYKCLNYGIDKKFKCPIGMRFNQSIQTCDWGQQVNCGA